MKTSQESRTQKEARELARLNKEAARPKPAHYMLFIMVVLTIIYIVD